MALPPSDIPVTLVIKAPSQRMDDQVVDCVLSWTVRKLKEHLETVYPSKPKYNEQRLIYSGRLLQDQLTLKDILRQYDTTSTSNRYTLHLVCSASSEPSPLPMQSEKDKKPKQSTPVPSPRPADPVTVTPSSSGVTTSSSNNHMDTDGLRHRGAPQPNPTPYPGAYSYPGFQPGAFNPYVSPTSAFSPTPTSGEGYSPEQYSMMMQQMYSQYMMQYMQFYQNAYNPEMMAAGQPFSPYMQQPFPSPWYQQAQQPAVPQQAQNAAAADGAANNRPGAAPRQNVRMNAQGGMEEDEDDDGEPRDWLHHTYFIMRFLTFMGILFFYSNVTRFLIVFSGSIVIYVLQKFRKYMQRRDREQQRQLQQQQQQQQPQQQQQEGEQPPREEQHGDGPNVQAPVQENPVQADNDQPAPPTENTQAENQANEEAQQLEEGGRLSRLFMFACNTVQAFFTSLLPAPPELLEAN